MNDLGAPPLRCAICSKASVWDCAAGRDQLRMAVIVLAGTDRRDRSIAIEYRATCADTCSVSAETFLRCAGVGCTVFSKRTRTRTARNRTAATRNRNLRRRDCPLDTNGVEGPRAAERLAFCRLGAPPPRRALGWARPAPSPLACDHAGGWTGCEGLELSVWVAAARRVTLAGLR